MPQILFANPIARDSLAISQWFKEQGFQVEDRGRLDPQTPPRLIVLRTWAELSYGEVFRAFGAAALGEEMGIKVVNPLLSHLMMIDKKASNLAFTKAGLRHPQDVNPKKINHFPIIVKPRYGSQGRGVKLIENPKQLLAALGKADRDELIIQEFVEGKTVRVIATGDQALYAYFKQDDGPVASISQGAIPLLLDPIPGPVAEIAVAAVKSVKGHIAGVDIIIPQEGDPLLLEINSSFRMPLEINGALETICREMLA